jgi:hypothetical protein
MHKLIASVLLLALAAGPALAEQIQLENGDKIDVTIVEETEDTLVVEHPQLGRMTVPRSALKPPKPPHPGLFGTDFMEGWERNIGFGFSGASGNSNDSSINASLQFGRDAERYRGKFDSAYFFSTQQNVRNKNEFYAAYNHDFLFKESRFFAFGRGRYQYDQFQTWMHRIAASAGGGYDIVRNDKGFLSFELGAGGSWSEGDDPQWKPEGVVGLKGVYRPFQGHEAGFDATYFPDLADLPVFRLLVNAYYQIDISPIEGLSLRAGLKDEYDDAVDTSQINPNTGNFNEKNNLKYFGTLVYAF